MLKSWNPTIVLVAFSMFITGFCGLIAEYLLATTSSFILGNSIEQFTITIAIMFLSMAAGSFLQQFIKTGLVAAFIRVELLLSLLIGYSAIALYAAYATMENHFTLSQYLLTGMIGLLIGFEAPLIARIIEKEKIALKVNLSIVLSLDAIGGALAGYIWVKYLLGKVELFQVGFAMAGLNLLVALLAFIHFARKLPELRTWLNYGSVVAVSIALIWGFLLSPNLKLNLEQRLYEDRIIWSETTPYQHLTLTQNKKLNEYRLYINGNTQFASSDEHIYHENLVHPAMAINLQTAQNQNVLILGGGDGLALREVKKYPSTQSITLVDLDPAMVRMASEHPVLSALNDQAFADARLNVVAPSIPSPDQKVDVRRATGKKDQSGNPISASLGEVYLIHQDAYTFVRNLVGKQSKFDVIIIDLPDPSSEGLSKLYSKYFFVQLRRLLSANGIIAIQATSPFHAPNAFGSILATLEAADLEVLPYHDNVPSFGDWGWILAQQTIEPLSLLSKIQQVDYLSIPTRYLDAARIQSNLQFGKDVKAAFLDPAIEVNTLMHPVLLRYYLKESWKFE